MLALELALAVPPPARRDHGGDAVVDATGVDGYGGAEAVARHADALGVDLGLLGEPGDGVARVGDLIHAQDVAARAAGLSQPAEIDTQRRVAPAFQHLRLDLGVALVLRAHEPVQHDERRQLRAGLVAIGDVQHAGNLYAVGLEADWPFHSELLVYAIAVGEIDKSLDPP